MFGLSNKEKLLKAAKTGDLESVQHLIENECTEVNAGGGINAREDGLWFTCCFLTLWDIYANRPVFMNKNLGDTQKATPLYLAAQGGHTEVVDYLLEFDDTLEPALYYAIQEKDPETLKFLVDYTKINVNSHDMLYRAAEFGSNEAVEYLLSEGAMEIGPAISVAEERGYQKTVQLLKNYNRPSSRGKSRARKPKSTTNGKSKDIINEPVAKSSTKRREQALTVVKQLSNGVEEIKKLALVGKLCDIMRAGDYEETSSLYEEIAPKIDKSVHSKLQEVIREHRGNGM